MTTPNPAPTPPNRAVEQEALRELCVERIGIAMDNGMDERAAEKYGRDQARLILAEQRIARGSGA